MNYLKTIASTFSTTNSKSIKNNQSQEQKSSISSASVTKHTSSTKVITNNDDDKTTTKRNINNNKQEQQEEELEYSACENFNDTTIENNENATISEKEQNCCQNDLVYQTKQKVYNELKKWDIIRIETLKKHLTIVEKILECQELRVKNSQQYMLALEAIMIGRLKELFVLMKNSSQTYAEHHALLKTLVMYESSKEEEFLKKHRRLKEIFSELCRYKKSNEEIITSKLSLGSPSKKNTPKKIISSSTSIGSVKLIQEDNENGSHPELDESSVAILKSNVRYMIDCELPDISEAIVENSQEISKLMNESRRKKTFYSGNAGSANNDLYILLSRFLYNSALQVHKHKEIAKELISLNKDFIEREKNRSKKIRETLAKWVMEDIPTSVEEETATQSSSLLLIKQLEKESNESLIEDYYNIEEMLDEEEEFKCILEEGQVSTITLEQNEETNNETHNHIPIEEYLLEYILYYQTFSISIPASFCHVAEELLLLRTSCFYNRKIETEILITLDNNCHLMRHNNIEPEFSFVFDKMIQIEEDSSSFIVKISKLEKKHFLESLKEKTYLKKNHSASVNISNNIEELTNYENSSSANNNQQQHQQQQEEEKEFEFTLEFNMVDDLIEFREIFLGKDENRKKTEEYFSDKKNNKHTTTIPIKNYFILESSTTSTVIANIEQS